MVRVLRVAGLKYVLRSVNRSLRWFDVRPRTSAIVAFAGIRFLKKGIVEINGKHSQGCRSCSGFSRYTFKPSVSLK